MHWIDKLMIGSEPTSTKQLRSFGLLVGGIFGVICVWPFLFRAQNIRMWAAALAVLLIVPALAMPRALRPAHRVWMSIGLALGWINSRIILGIMFYAVFTPVAFVMRLLGHDPMRRKSDSSLETYRIQRQPRPASHMRHQF